MFHGVLTLLKRSIKSDARLRRAHAFRIVSTMLIFLFLIVAHVTSGGVGSPGLRFFELISWLNLALITLAGASFFATAITEEKEEGTLGLLQLAGVSNVGLLLGKSTSRLIAALLVFLVQFPFALLAVSLGGVTVGQIVAVYVSLAAYMVMLANVALLTSVGFARSGMACGAMILFLLLLLAGVHVGDHSINTLVSFGYLRAESPLVATAHTVLYALQRVSIVTRIQDVLHVDRQPSLLGIQVMLHLIVAAMAFLVSWLTFERFTRYSDVSAPARGMLPKVNSRLAFVIERPWEWPLMWKDYHFLTGGHTLALVKLIGYPLLLVALYYYEDMLRRVTGMPFAQLSRLIVFILLGCELCLYASRLFHDEMKWGTLPNLLMLPHSVAWIAFSKVVGCLLALMPGFVALCGLHVFLWREIAALHLDPSDPDWMVIAFDFLGFLRTFVLGDLTEPGLWMIFVQFAVLLHLTVLCSLIVKWGGLALAIGIQLVLNALLSLPMSAVINGLTASYHSDQVAIAPILYIGSVACVAMQFLIGLRLRMLASE